MNLCLVKIENLKIVFELPQIVSLEIAGEANLVYTAPKTKYTFCYDFFSSIGNDMYLIHSKKILLVAVIDLLSVFHEAWHFTVQFHLVHPCLLHVISLTLVVYRFD